MINKTRLSQFYRQSLSGMLCYIMAAGKKNRPEAEDIVQDLFLKLWEKRNQLADIESLESYTFIMLRNRLINEHKRKLAREKALQYIADNRQRPVNLTEQELLYRELNKAFERSMHGLPPKMRRAFQLQQDGLKTTAIAGIMNVSIPVAKNHLRKAKKKIRINITSLNAVPPLI